MTAIERTAYPRFKYKRGFSKKELENLYAPTNEEIEFIEQKANGSKNQFHLLLFLKSFQVLGYFVSISKIPKSVRDHIATKLRANPNELDCSPRSKIRHYERVREFLKVKPYDKKAKRIIINILFGRSKVIDHPADLINVAIEELINQRYELPAFSHIDRLVHHVRYRVNTRIFQTIFDGLDNEKWQKLTKLLIKSEAESFTEYNRLKQYPKSPTLYHLKDLIKHIEWLESFGDFSKEVTQITASKIMCFASEIKVLDAGEIKDMSEQKQIALLVSYIHQSKVQTRDHIAEMLIRRVSKFHKKGRDELDLIHEQHRKKTEHLITTLGDILKSLDEDKKTDRQNWLVVKKHIKNQGGVEHLLNEYETVSAYNGNNYLPLLWKYYGSHRPTLFKIVRVLDISSTTQDYSLIRALSFMLENETKRTDILPISSKDLLSFASEHWKKLVLKKEKNKWFVYRRHFEVCVFSSLASELQSLDLFINGSESFADYRKQLIPMAECEKLISEYCEAIGIPDTANGFIAHMKNLLKTTVADVDKGYPQNTNLEINDEGIPLLKKIDKRKLNPSAKKLLNTIHQRMPERNILDILVNAIYWINFIRHFGPASGNASKLANELEQYVVAIFAYGCNLGATQAARHLSNKISSHMIQFVNKRHINAKKLDRSLKDVINVFNKFDLPKAWGKSNVGIVDGTQYDLYEENLLAESHIRYGGYGGIAYHHISDTYIALFSHFIPCGVWEAIYIIEGLLKNSSDIQIDTVYADTQGQSTTVFAVSFLLGIQLEPRIRNWKDLKFFRPSKDTKYKHIDDLFDDNVINWALIEKHWKDILQVILSIKAGKISSAVLLRKLSTYSKKNKLYQAFRELGYVVRTIFLLRYISDTKKRQNILSSTTKVESFHTFCKWFFFGSLGIISSNYFDEQEKAIKYNSLVANIVMLQNVVDMSAIIQQLENEGMDIDKDDLSLLSPYMTSHIKRFGNYIINIDQHPPELEQFQKILVNQ